MRKENTTKGYLQTWQNLTFKSLYQKKTSFRKDMEGHKNPILERQLFWMNHIKSISFIEFLKGKPRKFLDIAMIIAQHDNSTSPQTWFDFVDGIIGSFASIEFPDLNIPQRENDKLVSAGFNAIIEYLKKPKIQKTVLDKYQFGTDYISFYGQNQTVISPETLFRFVNSKNKLILSESDVIQLRKEFLEKTKENYRFLENEPANDAREDKDSSHKSALRKEDVTIDKLALLLYFINDKKYNHDFNKIAKEFGYLNGTKLEKTFSILTKQIRRIGNCKELESHTLKINRIEEFKWAIERLPMANKQQAIDEMKILESRLTVEE